MIKTIVINIVLIVILSFMMMAGSSSIVDLETRINARFEVLNRIDTYMIGTDTNLIKTDQLTSETIGLMGQSLDLIEERILRLEGRANVVLRTKGGEWEDLMFDPSKCPVMTFSEMADALDSIGYHPRRDQVKFLDLLAACLRWTDRQLKARDTAI